MNEFFIDIEQKDDVTVMVLSGVSKAVNKQSSDVIKLRDEFKELAADGKTKVIVDLTNIEFLASDTIGSFISGLYILRKKGGNLVLFNPSDYVERIFEIVRLQDVIKITENYDEALSFLK